MRRSTIGWQLVSALTFAALPAPAMAQDAQQASAATERWTTEELDNLLAPIALYPDPILAQVLIAATYPDQVLAAQAHVKAFGTDNIDQMPWEISVKAVARYEPVLNLLADGEDWMTALGQAYATQPTDVMNSVQNLRRMANVQGNLQSTPQQQVVVEREVIRIVPAEPQVIYVPTYDPAVVYHRPVYIAHAHPAYWSWGIGYPVGVWLTYDFDWWGHRVYYHGWHSHGPRWVVVARPWIVINPIYISPRHTVIVVNRGVVHRRWDTRYVRRYSVVHRGATFDRHDRGYRRTVGRGYDTGRNARGVAANTGNSGRRVGPREDAYGNRVVPLPSGGAARGTRSDAVRPERSATATRTTAPRSATPTRSDNGTWNPRVQRSEASAPAATPRSRGGTPSATPRSNSGAAPRATAPRGNSDAPRASAPRGTGGSMPQASAPRGGSGSTPRASAPSGSSGGTPRASAPRGGSGSTPRASAPRGGGGGGAARGGGGGSSRGGGGDRGGSRGGRGN